MAKKPTFVIKYKYPEQPWVEWARTQVPALVSHYKAGAQADHPAAEVKVFEK